VAAGKAKKTLAILFAAAALLVQPQRLPAKNLKKQFKDAAKDFHHGRLEKAEREFAAILAAQPGYPGAKIFLAETCFLLGLDAAGRGRPPVAVQEIKRALRLDPDEPYWHSTLAALLEQQGDPIGAAQECKEAARLSPNDAYLAEGCGLKKQAEPEKLPEGSSRPHGDSGVRVFGFGTGITSPRPLDQPVPEYTDKARLIQWGGTVVLSIVINAQGNVEEERVVTPVGLGLDEQALATARTWKFEPARRDGIPIPVRVSVAVSFRLE
jgi:TonB family protein